jgi:hypothetical protein
MVTTLKENDQPVPRAPTGAAGKLVDAPAASSASAPQPAPPAAPAPIAARGTPAPSSAPVLSVGLPLRPRLRVSYFFHGDELKCEATLMDERRQLVRRSQIDTSDPTVERIFSYLAGRLVADLRATGVSVSVPASQPPSMSAPISPSSVDKQSEPTSPSSPAEHDEEPPQTHREGTGP